jgi:hypothetical protein
MDRSMVLLRKVNIAYHCRLILFSSIDRFVAGFLREIFMEALTTLVQDVFELVANDPLDIISDSVFDTVRLLITGVVRISCRLIRIIMAVLLVAGLCCMDVTIGSLRLSMCLMDLCLDTIEVLIGRFVNTSPRLCLILHVMFLSLLILFLS